MAGITLNEVLEKYASEAAQELENILWYWIEYTLDQDNGGFYGQVNEQNQPVADAPRGAVLNSRILWTFSSATQYHPNPEYTTIATRAFEYIRDYFIDKTYGGVYWTIDHKGVPLDSRKQVYAVAFALYGMSEYFRATEIEEAKTLAIALFHAIEQYSRDKVLGGYDEAFTRDWKPVDDLRLSKKDANEKKTTNTHLHILEAYANLYSIWPDSGLKSRIRELVRLFLHPITDSNTGHLKLFFDAQWQVRSALVSYGHDIEAAWLVQQAAEIIGDAELLDQWKPVSIQLTEAAITGLDSDGGLWYEYEPSKNYLVTEKHWWPQAEAMVGFLNAWQLTGEARYLEHSLNSWKFIRQYILDKKHGEWYWGINADYSIMKNQDKAGIWKCPYHNGRACMEILRRVGGL